MNIFDLLNGSCKNTGSEDAPPFSLAPYGASVQVNDGTIFTFSKSASSSEKDFLVTGPGLISSTAPNNFGDCQTGPLVVVKYAGSDPTVGDEYTFNVGSWVAHAGTPGCLICRGIVDSDLKLMYAYLHPIVAAASELKMAVLDEDLETGSHAMATVRERASGDSHDDDPYEETDEQIKVFDGCMGTFQNSIIQDTGIVVQKDATGRWIVVDVGCTVLIRE